MGVCSTASHRMQDDSFWESICMPTSYANVLKACSQNCGACVAVDSISDTCTPACPRTGTRCRRCACAGRPHALPESGEPATSAPGCLRCTSGWAPGLLKPRSAQHSHEGLAASPMGNCGARIMMRMQVTAAEAWTAEHQYKEHSLPPQLRCTHCTGPLWCRASRCCGCSLTSVCPRVPLPDMLQMRLVGLAT